MKTPVRHPAKFSDEVLDVLVELIDDSPLLPQSWRAVSVLDPFAGVGRIHELRARCVNRRVRTRGIEIEPEWARCSKYTTVGDALHLPSGWSRIWHVVATSPCYGNRFADSHEANDECSRCDGTGELPGDGTVRGLTYTCTKCDGTGLSPRRSYKHDLGRPVSAGSIASTHWGDAYREFHEAAWLEVHRVLMTGGFFLLNVKDHVRDKQRQRVSAWHRRTVESIGFERVETVSVPVPSMRFGANFDARIANEYVYVFKKKARR